MKRIISILLTVAILLSLVPAAVFATEGETAPFHPFTDVQEGDWYNDYVAYVWKNGIFYGISGHLPDSGIQHG